MALRGQSGFNVNVSDLGLNPRDLSEFFASRGAGGPNEAPEGATRGAIPIENLRSRGFTPTPLPTRGIGGPSVVNRGIQNTPAPVQQLQDNPSEVPGTPPVPSTPVTPSTPNAPTPDVFSTLASNFSPAAGAILSGSGLLDTLRNRLKTGAGQF